MPAFHWRLTRRASRPFVRLKEQPPEIVFKAASDAAWSPVTSLNADAADDYPGYPDVRPIAWKGAAGLGMEGLVLLPRTGNRAPADDRRYPRRPELGGQARLQSRLRPTVRRGRLCSLSPELSRQCRLGQGIRHAKYRRSRRRGVRGHSPRHRPLRRSGLGRSRSARRDRCKLWRVPDGVGGGNHGSFQGGRHGLRHLQSAEQPLFVQPSFPRFHQWRAAQGRALPQGRPRPLALLRLDQPTTPTLILHGSEDRCTPLGQAQEFHAALLERGVKSELVVYPREGHGFQERGHRLDAWQRTVTWFDRHIGKKR